MRRRIGERPATFWTRLTVKHGGGFVIVWRAFANCRVGDLLRIKGKLNQTGYHSTLLHNAIPSTTQIVTQGFVLKQDNDPEHTSKLCQSYLKSTKKQHVLQLISWEVQSADLNPIELVWNEFDRKVRTKHKLSRLRLKNTLTASLLRSKTPPTSVLDMTLNNLMARFQ